MKKHIQIKESYLVWRPSMMFEAMFLALYVRDVTIVNAWASGIKRPLSLVIEWWLHNIGYYLTKPFIFIPPIKSLNERFKHVDLMIKFEGEKT